MTLYRVTFQHEVDADSPADAARLARSHVAVSPTDAFVQGNPHSTNEPSESVALSAVPIPSPSADDPVRDFVDVFSATDTAYDLGRHLTCTEADAYAGIMLAHGRVDAAHSVTEGHLDSEEDDCTGPREDGGEHLDTTEPIGVSL